MGVVAYYASKRDLNRQDKGMRDDEILQEGPIGTAASAPAEEDSSSRFADDMEKL